MIDVPQQGSVIWTERDFDAHDYALLCSYTHPDATPADLDLITEWYVWVFYFDDHFLEMFKRSRDLPGARAYLDALAEFMPVDGEISPVPGQPGRTRPRRPVGPHRPRAHGGLAPPVRGEHQEPAGGVALGAGQHQRGAAGQPDRVHRDAAQGGRRPLVGEPDRARGRRRGARAVRGHPAAARSCGTPSPTACTCATTSSPTSARCKRRASCPTACWSSSASSASRPSRPLTRSTTCSPRGCTSSSTPPSPRCPPLLEEHDAGPRSRIEVGLYVKGLQDWQSGGHEWHMRSSRYMNSGAAEAEDARAAAVLRPRRGVPKGLGTSAVRAAASLAAPRRSGCAASPTSPSSRSAVSPARRSACRSRSRSARTWTQPARTSCAWAHRTGLLSEGLWDERKLRAYDFALCAGRHPPGRQPGRTGPRQRAGSPGEPTATTTIPRVFGRGADLAGARACNARLSQFMPVDAARARSRQPLWNAAWPTCGRPRPHRWTQRPVPRCAGPSRRCSTAGSGSWPTRSRTAYPIRSTTSRCAARRSAPTSR